MNKLLLVLFCFSAMVTFCFFSPLFLVVFGLCIVLFGIIALFKPELIKTKKIQDPFYKRVVSTLVCVIGGILLTFGCLSTYQLYIAPDSKKNVFDTSNQNPQSSGSNTNRPGTKEEANRDLTAKKTRVSQTTKPTPPVSAKHTTSQIETENKNTETSSSPTDNTTTSSSSSSTSFPGKGNGLSSTKTSPASTNAQKNNK